MSQNQYYDWSDPRITPALPPRPKWATTAIVNPRSESALDAAKSLMTKWNRWADRTDVIFEIMDKQLGNLDVPDDDFIGLIRLCAQLPARPEIKPGETFENKPGDADTDFARIPLIELNMQWDAFADVFETTYANFAKELSWRKVRAGGTQEMLDTNKGDLDLSKLSLTAGPSDKTSMRSILGSMVAPRQYSHRVHERTEPAASSKNLDIERRMSLFEQEMSDKKECHKSGSSHRETEDPDAHDLDIQHLSIQDQEMEDFDTL